ncbi:MAG TPA: hypothetical protein VFM55_00910 [Micromonosporaceae bacterium]|nr:hypothetical protein [Micromonosporaceae bacterium]
MDPATGVAGVLLSTVAVGPVPQALVAVAAVVATPGRGPAGAERIRDGVGEGGGAP